MKKLTAILLAVLMVSFCFAVSASAEESLESTESVESTDSVESTESTESTESVESTESSEAPIAPAATNLVAGKTYTLTSNDEVISYQGSCEDVGGPFGLYTTPLLTDGKYRQGVSEEDFGNFNRSDGVTGLTVELAGSYRQHTFTFNLGAASDVTSVVVRNARRASNRYTNIVSVEALVNGAWTKVDYDEVADAVKFCEQYSPDQGVTVYDQFWDITCEFEAVTTSQIRITFDTTDASKQIATSGNGYIIHLDEIEVYGTAATSGGDDNNSGENNGPVTTPTGDTGLVVFAVLAVVALGGAVVAKKVK